MQSVQPEFAQALAKSYIGKYILVGVTYLAHDGSFLEQVQMHGVIQSVSTEGWEILLQGVKKGQTWLMPPDLDSVAQAKPGTYTLRSTGEIIENPNLLATWTVTKPFSS